MKRKKSASNKSVKGENKPTGWLKFLKLKWDAKHPILTFVIAYIAVMGLFYALWSTKFIEVYFERPLLELNAKIGGFFLNLLGQNTETVNNNISSSRFSIEVYLGCDAVEPTMLFVAAVLLYPISFATKIPGIIAGSVFLLSINMLRIISLFLIGVYWPQAFDTMHYEVWQVIFIILPLVSWVVWLNWAKKRAS